MSRRKWGLIAPLCLSGFIVSLSHILSRSAGVATGITWGTIIALFQSYLSTAAMLWAWNKPFFYWVWAGGMLFRLLVFAATFFVVYSYTRMNLVATMLSQVVATTLFLVIESLTFFKKKDGFSSPS